MSILDQFAANVVLSLIQGMQESLTRELETSDIPMALKGFAETFTAGIYNVLTEVSGGEDLSLIDALAANMVLSLIQGMQSSFSEIGNNANALEELRKFADLFIEIMIESITESINKSKAGFVEIGKTLMELIVEGMRESMALILEIIDLLQEKLLVAVRKAEAEVVRAMKVMASAVMSVVAAVNALIMAINSIPSEIKMEIKHNIADTALALNSLITDLNNIPTQITVTVDVVVNSGGSFALGGITGFAMGGIVPHATGGIVPHATGSIIKKPIIDIYKGTPHLFGEAGREAILPLDSYTGWMDEVAEKVDDRMRRSSSDEMSMEQVLINFYQGCLEPVMSEMSSDLKRQADKDERPVVKIGNRDIRTAYDTQRKADGYNFTGR